MIRRTVGFLWVLLVLGASFSNAQEKIIFLNGDSDSLHVLDTSGAKIRCQYISKGKNKDVIYNREDIFSIVYPNNREVVFYRSDSLSEDNFRTEEEMRSYIAGERDAIKGYSSGLTAWGCGLVGVASGVFIPPFLSPIVPAVYTSLVSSRYVKIKRRNVSEKRFLTDSNYISGYERTARGYRVQRAVLGTGIGLALGISAVFLIPGFRK
jgi:hypothetical protein